MTQSGQLSLAGPKRYGAPRTLPEPDRAGGPLATRSFRSLAGVHRCLLELFHDLIQVIARGVLEWRERLIGRELLEPQVLADGQQVPVVYVTRDRPAERAAEPGIRLFLLAPPRLEWIAFEVHHAGYELGLDSRGH